MSNGTVSVVSLASRSSAFGARGLLVAFLLLAGGAKGQGALTLANPHWNITLTDYGYSDFLLDNTPGFQGREYLSGEWAAAVGYQIAGQAPVSPMWLEPHFCYPDWTTPSTFTVLQPITQTGVNADGLPVAQSVIENGDVQVTLRFEMLDTIVGTPMGTAPASSGGAGAALQSDRYVLKQTCTVKNVSGAALSNLQLFQFLHGLQSQRGVYDDRAHAGTYGAYRYDTTLAGVDAWAVGTGSSSSGLEDYIGFHASVAPTGYEIGYYGIEGSGIDQHVMGKPSEGVHLSVEDNWQHAPYATRLGTDSFAPPQRWVAGAQRWSLGSLAAGQSASLDVLLSLCTGTRTDAGTGSTGGCNGGADVPGGLDYVFDDVTESGACFAEYARADASEMAVRVAQGELLPITFTTPGGVQQVWNVTFSGAYAGSVNMTFAYDPALLPAGFDESTLCIQHAVNGAWHALTGTTDPLRNTVTVTATSLGAFALGTSGGATYAVSAGAAPAAGGAVAGAGNYADGASATLVATASVGYAFASWKEGVAVVSTSPSYTFIVHGARTLTANFVAVGGSKTVSTGSLPSNAGTTSGDGAYAQGASATVTATASEGYKFSRWLLGGATVSTAQNYSFTVTNHVALVAKFKPVYRVGVTSDNPDGGEVEADPAYEPGELAKLKAVPLSGYSFVSWTENGIVVSTDPNYQFTVSGPRELVGHFAPGYRLDLGISLAHSGLVAGAGVYPAGSSITVSASANPGYVFVNWTENGDVVSTAPVYELVSDASRALVANFLQQPALKSEVATSGEVQFAWPADASGWVLQESADLSPGSWVNSQKPVQTVGAERKVFVSPGVRQRFFRLQHP